MEAPLHANGASRGCCALQFMAMHGQTSMWPNPWTFSFACSAYSLTLFAGTKDLEEPGGADFPFFFSFHKLK